jgi:heme/copper-type cytochrome/quinol oxidase subunit 1
MTAIPQPDKLPVADYAPHAVNHDAHAQHEVGFVKKYIFSTDHKVIGLQFLFLGLFFFVVGGLEAMLVRWQLGWPDAPVPLIGEYMKATGAWQTTSMPPEFYSAAFTMHATLMIFFVIIPLLVGTFGNYLIPLKIGAPDMAFPFLNGLAFWSAFPAGMLMASSFFLTGGPSQAGWTVYPPLSTIAIDGSTWPMVAIVANFVALTMCFLYVCAYAVRPKSAGQIWGAATATILLALAFVLYETGFFQHPLALRDWLVGHRWYWAGFLVAVGFIGIMSAVGGRTASTAVSLIVSMVLAVLAVRGLQRAAFDGQAAWFLSVFVLGFSSILGAVNYMATIIKLRCPGMTMFRLPLSIWSLFITSILVLLATPVLASLLLMNLLEHHHLTSFFTPYNWNVGNTIAKSSGGGYPLLHQHLFWFYSHPAVYIMILPAMGMVSDILAVFARKPIFGYRPMVYALSGIAFLGFIVWAHHMFQSGMNPTLGTTFAISTMFIAVPSAIKVFNWLGTLWGGNIRFTAAMLFAIAFVSQFVVGGLSGIFMASTAVDVHIHDTYFIVAHIHYVLFGSSIFGLFASLYFWYPKMFGRMMSERWGVIHFWLTFAFFNLTFFPMHILGITGFPRRVAAYFQYTTYGETYQPMNQFISVAAFALGLSQIPFVINFIGSWFWGPRAPRNPWLATTLEWETESPPPHLNFAKTPVVHHGPYEYSSPLVEEDWLAQTRWVDVTPATAAALAQAKH